VLTRDTAAARLRDFPRRAAARPELRQAAVAVCLTCDDGVPALLLTRRAAGMRAHAGQWALPGGRLDGGETPVQGALRELAEEVGLVRGPGDVLGVLDDYVTRSGYVMTPVVVWAGATGALSPAEAEVAAAYQVPLADLDVDPVLVTIPESDAPVVRLPLLGGWLHAPTAAVVLQFCRAVCRGEVERVAHLEQPVFAWR
jgi:8-oxo-dGTP pyrophosphatase MutT (NUDIX family)